ncbi:MAG: hypothetical protein J7M05_04160 [Anaerolineae bacterium]|nr:hypothetical protein [Anaerolineae bacterium]
MQSSCSHSGSIWALWADERGAELVEWVALTLIVALASYAILITIRDRLAAVWGTILRRFLD